MTDLWVLRAAEDALWDSLGVRPAQHRVRLPSLGIDVRVQEIGTGPPVLFVHGGTTWGTSWADLAAVMPSFRCLLLDRPGTGCSDPLPRQPASLAELVALGDALLPDVLDALGLPALDLVATSFGGWFALRTTLVAPARVRRLAMLGWTAGAPVARLPLSLRMGAIPVLGGLMGRLPAGRSAVRAIFRSIGQGPALDAGRIAPEAIDAYAALLRHTATFQNERALGRVFLSSRQGLDESIVLSAEERDRITTPILFAWGGADPFGGADIAGPFAGSFPAAQLRIVPGAGHAPWMGEPAPIAALVSAFLRN
jgi:pimeloyl-ACP methyl ester carboxylesterase